MTQIQQALHELFKRHRIVFWYDDKRELRGEFDTLIMPGVELIELANNEFAVKHRVLREQPDQKFLLYHAGPPPEDMDNWLLDVLLAQGMFRADQAAIWLAELGLGADSLDIAHLHAAFLSSLSRRSALKALLQVEDTHSAIRMKMLAVCAVAEPRLDEILEALLDELAGAKEDKQALIRACDLESFLWQQAGRAYGYTSAAPSLADFAMSLFKSGFQLSLGRPAPLNNDALVFLKRWKDSVQHQAAFEALSNQFAGPLEIETQLHSASLSDLADLDLFKLVDQRILSELAQQVEVRTLSAEDCSALIRRRKRTHWYRDFVHFYEALDAAIQFVQALFHSDLTVDSPAAGAQRYTLTWFRLDQLYRAVIYHFRKTGQNHLLAGVVEAVENRYNNDYLLRLNNRWQEALENLSGWEIPGLPLQRRFFEDRVQPFLENRKKVYVIISDALRYEVAEELLGRIRSEDRYDARLDIQLAMLPSYTQLGMAALLPNRELAFVEDASANVLVDGQNATGTANREKILKQATGDRAAALQAEDFLPMQRDDIRDLLRETDVIYIYHNRIDAVGDKRDSEERVFEAVEDALEDLITIIKKLTAANATNLIVTADHGFLYQNRPIDESDYSSVEVSGQQVLYLHRRFALGKGLTAQAGLKHFQAAQVGLGGNLEIQLPKSIARLRLRGSGSRFVHGGAALQEVILPVLQINKKRESDLTQVTVELLRSGASMITAGQLSVTFYQAEPVSEKMRPRRLRAGIYTQAGQIISDVHELVFDLESENPREREIPVRFILTRESDQANNQEVILRMEEQVGSTTFYQEYRSAHYLLRRSFTSDFDF